MAHGSPEAGSRCILYFRAEQRGANDSWQLVYRDNRPCPALLEFLKGYASRAVEVELPAELPPAVYRIRLPEIGRQGSFSEGFVTRSAP